MRPLIVDLWEACLSDTGHTATMHTWRWGDGTYCHHQTMKQLQINSQMSHLYMFYVHDVILDSSINLFWGNLVPLRGTFNVQVRLFMALAISSTSKNTGPLCYIWSDYSIGSIHRANLIAFLQIHTFVRKYCPSNIIASTFWWHRWKTKCSFFPKWN